MDNCRLIMDCECVTKVIAPLRSRMMKLRVPSPEQKDIVSGLDHIAKKERIPVKETTLTTIASNSNRNMRRAIMLLQSSWNSTEKGKETPTSNLVMPPYELHIRQIVRDMLAEQSVDR